jgi:hypothetical protein
MDSDNDDMTDDENDDPVAAHDEIGDLAYIVLTVLGQTEDRSKSPAPGSMVTGNTYRPVFHNLFLTTSRHWGFQTFFEYRTEAVIERSDTVLTRTSEGVPWYDFVTVEFELDNAPDYATLVDDNNRYPAKLIGFYRIQGSGRGTV